MRRMNRQIHHTLAVLVAVAYTLVGPCSCLEAEAPLGAYLGCFDVPHITNLDGVKKIRDAPYTPATIHSCTAACRDGNYTITAISPDLHCWCAMATPSIYHRLSDSKCAPRGSGLVVLYQHDYAAHSKCRVAATPLTQEDIAVDYNQHNIEYTPANISFPGHMRIRMEGSSGARVQPKAPRQMYGQFEVTAKVDSAAGAVTAFYVRDADWYDPENKGDFEEIDVEFLNANPGVPHSVWLNSYHRGLSRGERLVNPDEYQQLLGLGNDTHSSNTWLTYTFTWQASHVIWAINGVPILRRTTGELVTWNDMLGKPYARIFGPPDKHMHVSFSMWSDSSRFHFGGELDYTKSPYYSYFRELRRIVCDVPITPNVTNPYGPPWLYAARSSWPAAPNPTYSPPPIPSPEPSPSPAPGNTSQASPQAVAPAAAPAAVVNKTDTQAPHNAVSAPANDAAAAAAASVAAANAALKSPSPAPEAPKSPQPAIAATGSTVANRAQANSAAQPSVAPAVPNAAPAQASSRDASPAATIAKNAVAAASVPANAAAAATAPAVAVAEAAAPPALPSNAASPAAPAKQEVAHAAQRAQGHTATASSSTAHRRPKAHRRWLQQLQDDWRAVTTGAALGAAQEEHLAEAMSAIW